MPWFAHDQVMNNNGSTFFLVLFQELIRVLLTVTLSKNSTKFFILLYFCKSYLLKLSFVLRFFSSHYPKHATIVVHENYWDNLKAPPDSFTFMWYSCGTWVITKTFPAVQDVNGTSAKTFPDMLYKTSKSFATHV